MLNVCWEGLGWFVYGHFCWPVNEKSPYRKYSTLCISFYCLVTGPELWHHTWKIEWRWPLGLFTITNVARKNKSCLLIAFFSCRTLQFVHRKKKKWICFQTCGDRSTGFHLVWPGETWSSCRTLRDLSPRIFWSLCPSLWALSQFAACLRGTAPLSSLFQKIGISERPSSFYVTSGVLFCVCACHISQKNTFKLVVVMCFFFISVARKL